MRVLAAEAPPEELTGEVTLGGTAPGRPRRRRAPVADGRGAAPVRPVRGHVAQQHRSLGVARHRSAGAGARGLGGRRRGPPAAGRTGRGGHPRRYDVLRRPAAADRGGTRPGQCGPGARAPRPDDRGRLGDRAADRARRPGSCVAAVHSSPGCSRAARPCSSRPTGWRWCAAGAWSRPAPTTSCSPTTTTGRWCSDEPPDPRHRLRQRRLGGGPRAARQATAGTARQPGRVLRRRRGPAGRPLADGTHRRRGRCRRRSRHAPRVRRVDRRRSGGDRSRDRRRPGGPGPGDRAGPGRPARGRGRPGAAPRLPPGRGGGQR